MYLAAVIFGSLAFLSGAMLVPRALCLEDDRTLAEDSTLVLSMGLLAVHICSYTLFLCRSSLLTAPVFAALTSFVFGSLFIAAVFICRKDGFRKNVISCAPALVVYALYYIFGLIYLS